MALNAERLPSGHILWQDDRFHKLGLDSVLLADFAPLKKNGRTLELGAGQGALALLLLRRLPNLDYTGVELLPEAAEIARHNLSENGFSSGARVLTGDFMEESLLPKGGFTLVLSNPPYFPKGGGKMPADPGRRAARCEGAEGLAGLCRRAAALLAFGGCFSLVYRPERIAELFWHLQAAGLAPKVVRTVQKDAASAPSLLLMTAKKGAAPGVLWRPPLILTDQKGGESAELRRIYGEEES